MVKTYKLEDISMQGVYVLTNGMVLNIMRKGCNKWGNPLYRVYIEREVMEVIKATKNRFGRVCTDRKNGCMYIMFTSYNIGSDLKHLFKICGISEE